MSARIAIVLGAGPGVGAAVVQALSKTHSVLLLSRSLPGTLPKLDLKIPDQDNKILACSSDGSTDTLKAAIGEMKKNWPEGKVDVAVANAGPGFQRGGFLEQKEEDFRENMVGVVNNAWNLAQATIPLMLPHGGTLLFTGATMAMRGGAAFSVCAPAAFARRALSQSLAREFGPKGIHVAHIILDGPVNTPRVVGMMGPEKGEDSRLHPEDIAKVLVDVINQPRSTWTQEMDLRPWVEKF